MLKTAFEPYGNVVNVKVIRDKGGKASKDPSFFSFLTFLLTGTKPYFWGVFSGVCEV